MADSNADDWPQKQARVEDQAFPSSSTGIGKPEELTPEAELTLLISQVDEWVTDEPATEEPAIEESVAEELVTAEPVPKEPPAGNVVDEELKDEKKEVKDEKVELKADDGDVLSDVSIHIDVPRCHNLLTPRQHLRPQKESRVQSPKTSLQLTTLVAMAMLVLATLQCKIENAGSFTKQLTRNE